MKIKKEISYFTSIYTFSCYVHLFGCSFWYQNTLVNFQAFIKCLSGRLNGSREGLLWKLWGVYFKSFKSSLKKGITLHIIMTLKILKMIWNIDKNELNSMYQINLLRCNVKHIPLKSRDFNASNNSENNQILLTTH